MKKKGPQGAPISAQTFSLYGISGSFHVSPNGKWKIRHFATKASANNEGDGGNCLSLLRELKPMRERVEASKIKDMASLLQRDLSDQRVASDLIPYLISNPNGIGFFPSVLVALVPKNFLNSENGAGSTYPAPKGKGNEVDYQGYWSLETYEMNGRASALSRLAINPDKTDLVVLDGQHRANAFRYATNTFAGVNDGTAIYAPFYSELQAPSQFTSELPITIVWFEPSKVGQQVTPLEISRRIFVDVNTNAIAVNESRNILLDDRELASICTASFYSTLASESFNSKCLSLIHAGFDCDDERMPSCALFTPSVFRYACLMFAVGKDGFDDLEYRVTRDSAEQQANTDRLRKFFKSLPTSEQPALSVAEIDRSRLNAALAKTFSGYVFAALSKFELIKRHVQAGDKLAGTWVSDQDVLTEETWGKIFCGGEGLYSSYIRAGERDKVPTKIRLYLKAMKSIDDEFCRIRAKCIGAEQSLVDKTFATLSSKASLAGYFMALSLFVEKTGWSARKGKGVAPVEQFVNFMNKSNGRQWVRILTDLKNGAVGSELNPRLWPNMRNLYLRVLQNNGGGTYFEAGKPTLLQSPDYNFAKRQVEQKIQSYFETNTNEKIPPAKLRSFVMESVTASIKILKECGITPLAPKALQRAVEERAKVFAKEHALPENSD